MKLFGRYKAIVSKINNEIAKLEESKDEARYEQQCIGFKDHAKYCHYSVVIHELDVKIALLKRMLS